jgi:hypothetical protein
MADESNNSAREKSAPPPPGSVLAKKALLPEIPAPTIELGSGKAIVETGGSSAYPLAPVPHRNGKEPLHELGTEEEKKPLVANISRARGAARGRLLAVGIFLSVLSISSRSLIATMRRVWNIRGHLESLQLADRRFMLEFSEEGDYNHVVKGGPWRCSDDAILIAPFREGEDPESVKFSSIPIWVQFRNIPFYLLSKTLAKDLAVKVGDFICIDNFSHGDLCDKYIRARVHMPIDRAIRRWIPIIDSIEDEEVVVSLHYERLPNFCFFCGLIGHKDTACVMAGTSKKKHYSRDLSVRPTVMEDVRRWLLPDKTELEMQAAASNTQNWHNQ